MAGSINKPVRGIRDSIPAGYFLGRTGTGNGPPILLPLSMFTTPGFVANTTIPVGLPSADILVGNAGGVATPVALSGDATLANTGALTLASVIAAGGPTGDSTHVAAVTYDAKGRLTTVSSVAIAFPVGANPTATASDTAVNGSASTFMRSDGAPAVQKASASQFGIVEVDGTTITATGGVITAVGSVVGANPTATIGSSAVNGVATTFMRSDGAPALPATLPALSGVNLTALNGSNITSGTLPDARLSNTIMAAGPIGDASHVAAVTYDAHGRLTTVTSVAIAIAAGAVSGLAAVATSGSASDLGSGTLPDARLSNTIAAAGPIGDGTHVAAITFDAHGRLTTVSSVAITTQTLMTRQVFLSGTAATYTTPANCRMIRIRMKGGGGAGGGSGTSGGGNKGADGNDTIFNSVHAGGGKASAGTAVAPGGTSSTGAASVRLAGAPGANVVYVPNSATTATISGGAGGGQGGGPGGAGGHAGTAGVVNTGGGGGSGGVAADVFANITTGNFFMYGGGGEGEYVELIITSPAGTYTYTVAATSTHGSASASGFDGADGASGYIIVDEYY